MQLLILEWEHESRTTMGYLKVVLLNSILESSICCPFIRKKGFRVMVSLKTVSPALAFLIAALNASLSEIFGLICILHPMNGKNAIIIRQAF
jgi:hypothetical protein